MQKTICGAQYLDRDISDYKGNPLIEALPPILVFDDVYKNICFYPSYEEQERNLPVKQRYHCIQRVFRYFQPWDAHFKLEENISIALMQGYIERNPLLPGYANDMNELFEAFKLKNCEFSNVNIMQSSASGFTLVGFSGMGKTSAINSILRMYPQVIIHKEYQGQPFYHQQLVWLKLDCPFDGSVKGLCSNFLQEIDIIFGDNQYAPYITGKHVNTDVLIPIMTSAAKKHSLGLLIIDEIQHLNAAKSGGYEKMLNFFVNLVNKIGIPVILIGTTKALGILQSEFRQARRGSGHTGDIIWENMIKNKEWDLLIKGLFRYQWTKEKFDFSEGISNALYDKSQGIVDIAVKLFAMSQIRAISSGIEKITPNIICAVAKESLKLVEPMISALRRKDVKALQKIDDIQPIDIGSFISNETKRLKGDENTYGDIGQEYDISQLSTSEIIEKTVLKLAECNVDSATARKAVIKVLKGKKKLPDLPVIFNDTLKLIFEKSYYETVKPVKSAKELKKVVKK